MIDRMTSRKGEIRGNNIVVYDLESGHGSSGSAIVSREQNAIIGILAGGYQEEDKFLNGVAVGFPVSKFRIFWKAVRAGKYPWYQPSD